MSESEVLQTQLNIIDNRIDSICDIFEIERLYTLKIKLENKIRK